MKLLILMLLRKITNELIIWCIFLVAIYICISFHFEIIQLPNLFSFDYDVLENINDIAVNLSYSLIAGIIFYFFSVILPEAQKSIIIFPTLLNELDMFVNEFLDLSIKLCGYDWVSNKLPHNDILCYVFHTACERDLVDSNDTDIVEVKINFKEIILQFYNRADSILEKTLMYEKYLTKSEYKMLLEIRSNLFKNNQFYRDFINENIQPSYTSKTLKCYINGLIELNYIVIEINNSLKRINN